MYPCPPYLHFRGTNWCFWPTSYRLHKPELPTTSSLNSINLLEWLKVLRETVTLLYYRFIIKVYNLGTGRWKGGIRQTIWKRTQGFHALWVHHSCSTFTHAHQLEAFRTPPFLVFMVASLYRHNWLNLWPLLTLKSQGLSPPTPTSLRLDSQEAFH